MAKHYRKTMVTEAVQWTGTSESLKECDEFVGKQLDVADGYIVLGWDYIPRGYYIVKEPDGSGFYKVNSNIFEDIYEEIK